MRRPPAGVLLAGLVLLAGCGAADAPATDGGSPPATSTGTDRTAVPATTSAAGTTATPAVPESRVVDAADLSPEGRALVEELVTDGTATTPPPSGPALYPPESFDYVRFRGVLYEVSASCGGLVGGNEIASVDLVGESLSNETFTLVGYRNLSSRARTVFDRALERDPGAEPETYWDGRFPDDLEPGTVVRYEGRNYRLSIVAVDAERCRYEVEGTVP